MDATELRGKLRDWLEGKVTKPTPEIIRTLLDELDRVEAEVARCHARLEIDHVFVMPKGADTADDLVRQEVPMSERATMPDAVYCRDATIALIESRLAASEAALSETREDTERLDWLDAVNLRTNERNGTVYGWQYDINHNRASLTDHNLPALTAREAIDCARLPERKTAIIAKSATEAARLAAFDAKYPGLRRKTRSDLLKDGEESPENRANSLASTPAS